MININFIDEDFSDDHAMDIHHWIEEVVTEFEKSTNFNNLNSVERENCNFLISIFYESNYSYCLVGPGRINKETINEMMLDVMPRKISADKKTFESFYPVMSEFLQWCESKKYMSGTEKIREHIYQLADEMVRRSQDSSYWGMTKSILSGVTANLNFGNDYSDINQSTIKPFKRDEPKIGRNDPCSCGSGKKYKKCCLN